jgi:hypothetical protein
MNRKSAFSLIVVLIVTIMLCTKSALGEENIGVTVGQSFEYTYAFSGTERYSNGSLNMSTPFDVGYIEKITIQEIIDTNVTIEVTRTQLDGTKETSHWWVDVSNGDGTASLVIIPANINPGEMIYPNWVNNESTTEGAHRINETILMKLGDQMIEVNHMKLTFTIQDQPSYWDYYWEKSTGLVVKYSITGSEIDEDGTSRFLKFHFQRIGLQQEFHPLIDSADYPVIVDSNSAIIGFEFNQTQKKLILKVSGTTGTSGFCDVTVPSSLLWGTFSLSMDGYPLAEGNEYTQTYNETHYIFHINYIHSTHTIEIEASDAIPEFPVFMILPIFMAITFIAVVVFRKRLNQSTN